MTNYQDEEDALQEDPRFATPSSIAPKKVSANCVVPLARERYTGNVVFCSISTPAVSSRVHTMRLENIHDGVWV